MTNSLSNLKDPFKNRYEITSSGEKKALDHCLVDNIFSLGYLIFWHTIVHSTGMDGACSVVSDCLQPHGL